MILSPDKAKPYQQPTTKTLHQLLKYRALTTPELVAIRAPDRTPLTYACLLHQVERTVEAMRAFGLKRTDRVALVLPNGPEMAVAFLAVAAAAICAPLNPNYREREFEFYLSDLDARALITWSKKDSPARKVAEARNDIYHRNDTGSYGASRSFWVDRCNPRSRCQGRPRTTGRPGACPSHIGDNLATENGSPNSGQSLLFRPRHFLDA